MTAVIEKESAQAGKNMEWKDEDVVVLWRLWCAEDGLGGGKKIEEFVKFARQFAGHLEQPEVIERLREYARQAPDAFIVEIDRWLTATPENCERFFDLLNDFEELERKTDEVVLLAEQLGADCPCQWDLMAYAEKAREACAEAASAVSDLEARLAKLEPR